MHSETTSLLVECCIAQPVTKAPDRLWCIEDVLWAARMSKRDGKTIVKANLVPEDECAIWRHVPCVDGSPILVVVVERWRSAYALRE